MLVPILLLSKPVVSLQGVPIKKDTHQAEKLFPIDVTVTWMLGLGYFSVTSRRDMSNSIPPKSTATNKLKSQPPSKKILSSYLKIISAYLQEQQPLER